uniref:Uncharacterized protein n=1 Tax=Cacopsylla melanoneura TaxID=428564 RepID=A0A8D8M6R3_9HEMI
MFLCAKVKIVAFHIQQIFLGECFGHVLVCSISFGMIIIEHGSVVIGFSGVVHILEYISASGRITFYGCICFYSVGIACSTLTGTACYRIVGTILYSCVVDSS